MATQVPLSMLDSSTQTLINNASSNASTALTNAATAQSTANAAQTAAASKLSGDVIQMVYSQTGAVATGSTLIPTDDTIPQNTEGDQYMSVTITPTDAASTLDIEVIFFGTHSALGALTVALFQDSTANALACGNTTIDTAAYRRQIVFRYRMAAGTTSATTFKVRAGGSAAGTTTFNGSAGARLYGGVQMSSITVREIKA